MSVFHLGVAQYSNMALLLFWWVTVTCREVSGQGLSSVFLHVSVHELVPLCFLE